MLEADPKPATGCDVRWSSSRNGRRESANERREDSAQLPTQAKTKLEWARPSIAYLSTITVAPVTSTIRGVPSEVVLHEEDGMKSPCAVNLHNAVDGVATAPGETCGPA